MRISDWSSDVCSSDLKDGSSEFTYQLVQILGEPITVNFWISGPFEQHVRDVGCVLVGYSHDKSHQLLASRLRDSADRSKVDKAHILFPDKENIARMRIAMEFAIKNDHAQDCIRILSRERRKDRKSTRLYSSH